MIEITMFPCLNRIILQRFIYLDYNCGDYEQQCADGLQCIVEYFVCDGREDCKDKSDFPYF